MTRASSFTVLAMTTLLAACDLSPDFTPPAVDAPEHYKEALTETNASDWEEAKPLDSIKRGQWWHVFGDEVLNQLQREAGESNPNLAIAGERVTQARALSGVAFAQMFPNIDASFSPRREKFSAGSPNLPPGLTIKPQTSYNAQGILTWELDLFGRLSGAYRVAELNADATEALYQSALLSLQADVAQLYFSIRALDAERALLKRTVGIREESLRISRRLYDIGEVSGIDQARAEAELAATSAESLALDRQRATLENALATLTGKLPSHFRFADLPLTDKNPPAIPAGIPSTLLARRPDIAAAIRQMEAANRNIGIARTAFLPRIALTVLGGFESGQLNNVFNWSNRAWSVGPVLTQPIFEGGRIFYEIDRLTSAREETVARYRQQVLVAFQDVEDSLASLRYLVEEESEQRTASDASGKAARLATTLYKSGDISFIESLDAERTALAARRGQVRAHGARYVATISLIRALGGGWDHAVAAPADKEEYPAENTAPETVPAPTVIPLLQEKPDETIAQ